jgi:hypothetical protein
MNLHVVCNLDVQNDECPEKNNQAFKLLKYLDNLLMALP